jgi:integrase
LSDAVKKGALVRNVAALADEPRVPQHDIEPLSPPDARRLLHAVKGDRLEALYSVAMALGLRQGEALGLNWADVDLKGRTLRIRCALQRTKGEFHFVEPKSQRSRRTMALPEAVVKALQAHWDRQQFEQKEAVENHTGYSDLDLVFCKPNGEPLPGTHLTVSFQRLLKRTSLPRQRFHDLRHTCASLLLAQGVHPRVVMEVLGHSNINLTMNT